MALVLAGFLTAGLVVVLPVPVSSQSPTSQSEPQGEALNEANLLNEQVIQLYQQGQYAQAIPLAQKVLTIREKALGPDHPDVAQSLNNLALLYQEQGHYAAAEPLLKRAQAIREKALGPDHPDVANSLNNLAALYLAQGHYAAAEPLVKRALAIAEKALGPDHPDVATSVNNLAALYQAQGNYAAAEPLVKRALAIAEKALGPNHPAVANNLNSLAALYQAQGNYAAAEPLFKRALAIRAKALGPGHPDVAQSLNNLAELYQDQGNYTVAEPLFKRALAIAEKALGPDHPAVAQSLDNLAVLYQAQGNYTVAEPLFKRALAIAEKALGPDHPLVATILNNLALLYYSQGSYAAAELLFKRALAIAEKALGTDHPDHPDVAGSLNNLAALYQDQGNDAAAEPLYKRALAIREKALGSDHPAVAASLNNLAVLYQDQRNYAAAEPLHKRALVIREKALGPDHPAVATSLNNLASLYQEQGYYAAAESLYQRALAIDEKALGLDHPAVANNLNSLAELYQAQDNNALAQNYLGRGLRVEEQTLSRNLIGGSERQKQLYLQTFAGTQSAAISLHLQAMPQDPRAAQLALSTILQRKGRILDLLSRNQQQLRQHLKPEEQTLFNQLSEVYRQLAQLTFKLPEKRSPQDKTRIAQLDTQIQTLEDQLSRRSAEFRIQAQPITLEGVQRMIPAHTALVEFVVYQSFDPKAPQGKRFGKPRYAAYILQAQGDPQGIDLGEADKIDQAIDKFRSTLQVPKTPDEQLKPKARAVDALVMQPVRARLGAIHHLLLSPDGPLDLIPFEALVDETNHYLVETTAFTYLTSGRDLLRLQTPFASKQPPLLLGDPYFERPPETVALQPPLSNPTPNTRSGDILSQIWPPLPGTKTEVQAVAALLTVPYPGSQSLIGTYASKGALAQAHSPAMLHIATHGFFQDAAPPKGAAAPTLTENPLLDSGLLLAGFKVKSTKSEDLADNGILTALEVTRLDLLGTKLVVLSACNTGIGKLSTGEGVYGLRRAFVIAGAESQLFSLWRIDDGFTPKLMESYYRKLLAGQGRSEALRQTQLEFMQSKDYSYPYYWASFIASGSWSPMK